MTLKSVLGRNLIWEYLLGPLLGPFSVPLRRRIAINEVDHNFAYIHQFIAECNESIAKYVPPGLLGSMGVSLTKWSKQGEDIVSNVTLKSLKKPDEIIPIRITIGTEQVKIGDELMSLYDNDRILNNIAQKVFDFFSM